jgi:hypothetical protein
MRHAALSLCLLLAAAASVRAADPPAKDEALDQAVDKALAFLQGSQNQDGSWSAGPRGFGQANPAVTGLCVMAFLSAGHVPGEGRYGDTVDKGVRWVLKAQQDNGLFAANQAQEMYHHGICTLMLAEAAGMTDGKLGEDIRKKLVKAVDVILKAQRTEDGPERGGWRYQVMHAGGSDMSVTGWQLMALRAAKNVGCDVPAKNIEEAVGFIKRCQDAGSGGFDYQPNSNLTVPCTGTGILALELCGKDLHRGPEVTRAGNFLLRTFVDERNVPRRGMQLFGNFPYYGVYYCSQAMFQLGDNYWDGYRPFLHETLFRSQKDNGSWFSGGADGAYGPSYSTAMCVLALTVEYRYLPIYQRGEEPTDKK